MNLQLKENIIKSTRLPRNDDLLTQRAGLLATADKELVEAVLIKGQSAVMLARVAGINPRTVRTRIHRLCKRLGSRRFLEAARAINYLPPEEARLARLRFCQGLKYSQLMRIYNISSHELRRRLDKISAAIRAVRRLPKLNLP